LHDRGDLQADRIRHLRERVQVRLQQAADEAEHDGDQADADRDAAGASDWPTFRKKEEQEGARRSDEWEPQRVGDQPEPCRPGQGARVRQESVDLVGIGEDRERDQRAIGAEEPSDRVVRTAGGDQRAHDGEREDPDRDQDR
jgi:hypothetical protein